MQSKTKTDAEAAAILELPEKLRGLQCMTMVEMSGVEFIICSDKLHLYIFPLIPNPKEFPASFCAPPTLQELPIPCIKALKVVARSYLLVETANSYLGIFEVLYHPSEKDPVTNKATYKVEFREVLNWSVHWSYFMREVMENLVEVQVFFTELDFSIYQFTNKNKVGVMSFHLSPNGAIRDSSRKQLYGSKCFLNQGRGMVYFLKNFSDKTFKICKIDPAHGREQPVGFFGIQRTEDYKMVFASTYLVMDCMNPAKKHTIESKGLLEAKVAQIRSKFHNHSNNPYEELVSPNREPSCRYSTFGDLLMVENEEKQEALIYQVRNEGSCLVGSEYGDWKWFFGAGKKIIGFNRDTLRLIYRNEIAIREEPRCQGSKQTQENDQLHAGSSQFAEHKKEMIDRLLEFNSMAREKERLNNSQRKVKKNERVLYEEKLLEAINEASKANKSHQKNSGRKDVVADQAPTEKSGESGANFKYSLAELRKFVLEFKENTDWQVSPSLKEQIKTVSSWERSDGFVLVSDKGKRDSHPQRNFMSRGEPKQSRKDCQNGAKLKGLKAEAPPLFAEKQSSGQTEENKPKQAVDEDDDKIGVKSLLTPSNYKPKKVLVAKNRSVVGKSHQNQGQKEEKKESSGTKDLSSESTAKEQPNADTSLEKVEQSSFGQEDLGKVVEQSQEQEVESPPEQPSKNQATDQEVRIKPKQEYNQVEFLSEDSSDSSEDAIEQLPSPQKALEVQSRQPSDTAAVKELTLEPSPNRQDPPQYSEQVPVKPNQISKKQIVEQIQKQTVDFIESVILQDSPKADFPPSKSAQNPSDHVQQSVQENKEMLQQKEDLKNKALEIFSSFKTNINRNNIFGHSADSTEGDTQNQKCGKPLKAKPFKVSAELINRLEALQEANMNSSEQFDGEEPSVTQVNNPFLTLENIRIEPKVEDNQMKEDTPKNPFLKKESKAENPKELSEAKTEYQETKTEQVPENIFKIQSESSKHTFQNPFMSLPQPSNNLFSTDIKDSIFKRYLEANNKEKSSDSERQSDASQKTEKSVSNGNPFQKEHQQADHQRQSSQQNDKPQNCKDSPSVQEFEKLREKMSAKERVERQEFEKKLCEVQDHINQFQAILIESIDKVEKDILKRIEEIPHTHNPYNKHNSLIVTSEIKEEIVQDCQMTLKKWFSSKMIQRIELSFREIMEENKKVYDKALEFYISEAKKKVTSLQLQFDQQSNILNEMEIISINMRAGLQATIVEGEELHTFQLKQWRQQVSKLEQKLVKPMEVCISELKAAKEEKEKRYDQLGLQLEEIRKVLEKQLLKKQEKVALRQKKREEKKLKRQAVIEQDRNMLQVQRERQFARMERQRERMQREYRRAEGHGMGDRKRKREKADRVYFEQSQQEAKKILQKDGKASGSTFKSRKQVA